MRIETKSQISLRDIRQQGEINGRWVVEANASEFHPAGTMVCEPAPEGTTDDLCFTAPNGKRYMDVPSGCRWTPRE